MSNEHVDCHFFRFFTDLIRGHVHFSLATPSYSNTFLVYWDGTDKEFEISTMDTTGLFGVEDYKRNTWHSLCTTWDPVSGLVQLWLDGQPSVKKFTRSVSNIRGSLIIMLGQVKFQSSSLFNKFLIIPSCKNKHILY